MSYYNASVFFWYNSLMRLSFFGGARSVTGANYLLETKKTRILVDCGLHQGSRYCEAHNFEAFLYDPKSIDAVFITHAHIDHIGRLPNLYRDGFRGAVFGTPPTKDFAELLLADSEHILRIEAERDHKPPLYNMNDIVELMKLWRKIPYRERVVVGDLEAEFRDAGHILGSSTVYIRGEGKTIAFSGDLGNTPASFINAREPLVAADYVITEGTYGNRIHENLEKRKDILEDAIEDAVRHRGLFLIPAFALERTQEMMYELNELSENLRIPKVPIFVDSPLAIRLTGVYQKYSDDPAYFNRESMGLIRKGDAIFDFPNLHLTLTTAQSKEIFNVPPPKVIIAGSGMSNAGRILFHEKLYLSNKHTTILFVGYQAKGSLGRQILDGAKEVTILGETVSVNARTKIIGGYSAHADQPQILGTHGSLPRRFLWCKARKKKPCRLRKRLPTSWPFTRKCRCRATRLSYN